MLGMSGTDVLVKKESNLKSSKILVITASSPTDAEMNRIRDE